MIRFDQMPPEVMQAMCTPMHEILPANPRSHGGTLWLGSLSATMDAQLLREQKISLLVQVLDAPWLPDPSLQGLKLDTYRMDILDLPSADLKPHLEGACDTIASALGRGLNVLVHCQQVSVWILFLYPATIRAIVCMRSNLILTLPFLPPLSLNSHRAYPEAQQ
jgi:hypothetical protein